MSVLDRLLVRMQRSNERALAKMPQHEQDQIIQAATDGWRATFRHIWIKNTRWFR